MKTERLSPEETSDDRQRLDKWIWFARMVKTRALAVELVTAGHVRLNGQRVRTPGKTVRVGDVLTLALERQVRVLRVLGMAERRGPFVEAQLLYEDLAAGAPGEEVSEDAE